MSKPQSKLEKKAYTIKKLCRFFLATSICLPLMTHSALAANPSEIKQLLGLEIPGTLLDCTHQVTLPEPIDNSTTAKRVMLGRVLSKKGKTSHFKVNESFIVNGKVVINSRYTITRIYEPENKRIKTIIEPDSIRLDKFYDPMTADEFLADMKSNLVGYINSKDIELLSPLTYKLKSTDESIGDMICKYTPKSSQQR